MNVTLKIIGIDENRQIITESSDYVIESTGIFQAKLRHPKKQIRFLKVFGYDTDYARNNRHIFVRLHPGNVAFIATVLDIIKAPTVSG